MDKLNSPEPVDGEACAYNASVMVTSLYERIAALEAQLTELTIESEGTIEALRAEVERLRTVTPEMVKAGAQDAKTQPLARSVRTKHGSHEERRILKMPNNTQEWLLFAGVTLVFVYFLDQWLFF